MVDVRISVWMTSDWPYGRKGNALLLVHQEGRQVGALVKSTLANVEDKTINNIHKQILNFCTKEMITLTRSPVESCAGFDQPSCRD